MEKITGQGIKTFTETTDKSKRNEHLKNASPIMSCLGTHQMFKNDKNLQDIIKNGEEVDFWNPDSNVKNSSTAYVISSCDDKDKWSQAYRNCTGIIVSGTEKGSHKQLSILTHQNPNKILSNFFNEEIPEKFIEDIKKSITDLISKCELGSIDAVLFGGNITGRNETTEFEVSSIQYEKSIKLLGKLSSEVLGFEPIVLTGPNMKQNTNIFTYTNNWDVDVYFDTKNRRLYLLRSDTPSNNLNHEYLPSEIDTVKPEWK